MGEIERLPIIDSIEIEPMQASLGRLCWGAFVAELLQRLKGVNMGWMSFIQWGFLLLIIAIFIFFKEIHLQVGRYNLFLLLLISCAYIVILSIWIMERRRPQQKESDGQEQQNQQPK